MSWFRKLIGGSGTVPPPAPGEPPLAQPPTDERDRAAFAAVYGGQVPFHYGVAVAFADGGPDPLDGVTIFWNDDGPHWHYISFGFAAMMGAELTFRLRATPADRGSDPASFQNAFARNAPTWPIKLLNMLARRVHRTQRPFRVGDWWEGAPGVLQPHSDFHFLAFARDPQLGDAFLQAIGVESETIEAMKRDEREQRGDATLNALIAANPLGITDAKR